MKKQNAPFVRYLHATTGITLIALVITIIVLLILAGVSISLVVGDNGVLNQASTSVVKTREANAAEELAMAWTSADAEYWNAWTNNSSSNKNDYFTAENLNKYLEGKGTVSSVKDNENGTHTVRYTSAEDDMVYEIIVDSSGKTTVSSSVHKSEVKETLASKITPDNYGDYVNYEIDLGIKAAGNVLSDGSVPKTDWRIFYKDTNNVYLIASDYLPVSKFPTGVFEANNSSYNGYWYLSGSNLTTSGTVTSNNSFLFTKLSNVTTTNYNYQAVSTLLDTSKWSAFAKTGYVDDVSTAVIGSPTVEMWMASWNERYEGETLSFDANETGYKVGLTADSLSTSIDYTDMQAKEGWSNTLYYPHASTSSAWNGCYGYWLASPSVNGADYVLYVNYLGNVDHHHCAGRNLGVRPVVSLSSKVQGTATTNEDGTITWTLSK